MPGRGRGLGGSSSLWRRRSTRSYTVSERERKRRRHSSVLGASPPMECNQVPASVHSRRQRFNRLAGAAPKMHWCRVKTQSAPRLQEGGDAAARRPVTGQRWRLIPSHAVTEVWSPARLSPVRRWRTRCTGRQFLTERAQFIPTGSFFLSKLTKPACRWRNTCWNSDNRQSSHRKMASTRPGIKPLRASKEKS